MNLKEIEVQTQNNEEGYDLHEKLAKREDEILLNTAENQSSKDTVLKETSMNDKGENYQDVEYEDNVVEFREIVIKRVQSASMRVEGRDINAVLDTGAEVTVLSAKVFESISKDGRPELGRAEGTLKMADAGTELMTEGVAEVKINVGNRVYVADISDDLLLGCDFVYEMNLTIHPKKGIFINDEWIKMNTKRSHNRSQLLVHETTTVPPMSDIILQGRSEDCENIDTRYAAFELFPSEEDVLFAKSFVDPFRKTIPVRIVNLHRFPVKFRKDAILGDLIPVLKIEEIDTHTEDPIDYIILYSSTITDHLEKLDEVLTKLQGSGLKFKPSKCEFIQSEVLYLGHVVSADGIKPNPKIVSTIGNWKSRMNVKEVQQFLGLCNYYRHFIYKFSERAASLIHLKKKGVTFDWTVHCEESFQFLKNALSQSPILAYPRPDHQFILDTDASNNGIGAVLSQVQDGSEKVIAYASKKLDQHQMRNNVTRRELLAVITFINQFQLYLLGRQFLLRTHHGSLRWLFNFKDPIGQLARWLELLS